MALFFIMTSALYSHLSISDDIPQYLFSDFAEGVVVKKGGERVVSKMNYNIVTEEMIFIRDNKFLALGNLPSVDTVYLNDMVFIPFDNVFYELAVQGTVKLYVQFHGTVRVEGEDIGYGISSKTSHVTTLSSLTDKGALYNMDLPENIEVSRKITFHIEKEGGKKERIVSKRAFLKTFKERREELNTFIDMNKINFSDYNDVVKLVEFLNSDNAE